MRDAAPAAGSLVPVLAIAASLAGALLCAACGREPELSRALPRVMPAPAASPSVPALAALRTRWHLSPEDLAALDGAVAAKLGGIRRRARVVVAPAELVATLPAETREVSLWLAPPLPADGEERASCSVDVALRFAGGQGLTLRLGDPPRARDTWLEVGLAVPRGESELRIGLEPTAPCAAPTPVAVSELLPRGAAEDEERPNLLLVVLDTLRRDAMDCAGASEALTPHLMRWCRRGIFFTEAWSTAPWTYPALASMLTGLPPAAHGAGHAGMGAALGRDVATAAERLGRRGYATAGVVSNWHATRGLWRGFDAFAELLPGGEPGSAARRRAERVVDAGLAWLESEPRRPFFLWLLFIDLHEPVDAGVRAGALPAECAGVDPVPFNWQALGTPGDPPGAGEQRRMACRRALYRGALRHVDAELGRLAERLSAAGLDRDTWILVTSDHGEEFWDHAAAQRRAGETSRGVWGIGHGHTLYRELAQVPLLLVPPTGSGVAPGRSDALVSIADVFGTLLARGGAPLPEGVASLDLAAVAGAGAARERVTSGSVAYGPPRVAVTTRELRAIWTAPDRVIAFDRASDPAERRPVSGDAPLARRARELLRDVERPPAAREPLAPDAAAREALEALRDLR